ncbi:MAG: 50S ribosomal protein L15 [Candidatus Doudnabacteria bacterium]
MKIHQLKKHPKSTKTKKRVGRGFGSGSGTYSGRGTGGQKSRSGSSKLPVTFEGGRMPLVRQIPKSRGFKSIHPKATVVKLDALNQFKDGEIITISVLKQAGLVPTTSSKVKVLTGKLTRKLTVKVPVSKTAAEQITAAGGSVK